MATSPEHDAASALDEFHDPTGRGFKSDAEGRLLFWIAVAFSVFQIATAAHVLSIPSQVLRADHVGFLMLLAFPMVASARGYRRGRQGARLGAGLCRGSGRRLPIYRIRAADPACRRSQRSRPGVRRRGSRHGVHRRLCDDGSGAADHLGLLSALCAVRRISALAAQPSRLRRLAGHRPDGLWHRGHLRHPGLCLGDLHLPVHPVRLVPRTRRHDQAVHRRVARLRRPCARRRGQGVGHRLGTDGHDLRLGRRQCRHHRPVHHPADEALRLSRRLCRRRRGDSVDGRPDHAAGDGRGGLHHGRDAGRRILRGRQGGAHPGDPVLRLGLLDGASGSRQAQSARPVEGRAAVAAEGVPRRLVPDPAAGGAGLPAVLRLHAALCRHDRPGDDGAPDPRRFGSARPALHGAAGDLLDRARRRRGKLLQDRHQRDPGQRRRCW